MIHPSGKRRQYGQRRETKLKRKEKKGAARGEDAKAPHPVENKELASIFNNVFRSASVKESHVAGKREKGNPEQGNQSKRVRTS
jgi:hypothetical protein